MNAVELEPRMDGTTDAVRSGVGGRLEPSFKAEGVTLYLGDCRSVLPQIERADVVITDPPYGLSFPYRSYDDTRENLVKLIADVMPEISRIAASAYILCGPTQIGLYPQPEWVCAVTWNTTGTFGKYGYNQWTPVLCYGKDLEGFGNVNGMTKGDTFRINGGGGVGFQRDADEKEHTCPKPLNLMKMVVNRYTKPGQTVLDCFMGIGTTGVACAVLGRKFIGIEQDAKHLETAVQRFRTELAQGVLPLSSGGGAEPVCEQLDAFEHSGAQRYNGELNGTGEVRA